MSTRVDRSRLHSMSRAGGAVSAQAMSAGASLLLQVVSVRTLGDAGYGGFTLLFAVLVLFTTVQAGFVTDARTVLDRFDPVVRDALAAFQFLFTLVSMVIAAVVALAYGVTSFRGSLLFGLLAGAWLLEDAGRRLFMTRLEFWRLVVNDLV